MVKINAIDKSSVHKICSGQVVISLAVAIKELVENSLDAKATKIEVKLKDNGSQMIEIVDNGSGIEQSNFEAITLKHYTSKLNDFEDLPNVESFGFRGEALSSLCHLGRLSLHTWHPSDQVGALLEFDQSGAVVRRSAQPRTRGTTVWVAELFHSLPVRRREFLRNLVREVSKALHLLSAYCVIAEGVQISCAKVGKNGREKTVVLSNGSGTNIRDNMAAVFGQQQMSTLLPLVQLNEIPSNIREEYNLKAGEVHMDEIRLSGWISTAVHGQGRSTPDRQFVFVNGRPCDQPRVLRLANELYRQLNRAQSPFLVLIIEMAKDSVDVNLAPDKRQVMIGQERKLLADTKATLLATLSQSAGCDVFVESKLTKTVIDQSELYSDPTTMTSSKVAVSSPEKKSTLINLSNLKRHFTHLNAKPQPTKETPSKQPKLDRFFQKTTPTNQERSTDDVMDTASFYEKSTEFDESEKAPCYVIKEITQTSSSDAMDNSSVDDSDSNSLALLNSGSGSQEDAVDDVLAMEEVCESETVSSSDDNATSDWFNGSTSTKMSRVENSLKSLSIRFSLAEVRERMKLQSGKEACSRDKKEISRNFRAKIDPAENELAEDELKKVFKKSWFEEMSVIGQFNLGFIVCCRERDLFIVDQHASDEKFNFEQLEANLRLESQKLVCPKRLQLTSMQEETILDNLDVFTKNGFEFVADESLPVGEKLKLVAVPMSKNFVFGKEDIEEMTFVINENLSRHCRPSRVRQLLASRACRKSIMIGTALNDTEMKRVLVHMSDMEQPWNCPHGRPTVRHLFSLDMLSD